MPLSRVSTLVLSIYNTYTFLAVIIQDDKG